MSSPIQQAAVRRKIYYLGLIVALFTISLIWRGKFPIGNPTRDAQAAPTKVQALGDKVARYSIFNQAEQLELRDLDQGDPEIATQAAQVMLLGVRGPIVTTLWWLAIDKQRRNEWREFELLVRMVTRLQPNFITPWIYQSWNIAYNVSVENDKLGDMFYYIARGIELLAQGDRLNTKEYRGKDGEVRKVGSPDIRFQIGFYYQNKFGVSDKVSTLRSLMQLSVMPPDLRDPNRMMIDGQVDMTEFREFCRRNPQLVRRLYTKLNLERPEQIVQFLEDNYKIPTRWLATGELAPVDDQFPVLPPRYPDGPDEFDPTNPDTDDTFDAFHAARAWFGYAITTIPPPKQNKAGDPIPWTAPSKADFDEFKYRLPRSPAYVIFRQHYPRAQTYLAERLSKEGWFDESSYWDPDRRNDPGNYWFRTSDSELETELKTPATAQEEWRKSYVLWTKQGVENALVLDLATLSNMQRLASRVPGSPTELPRDEVFTPQAMSSFGITQEEVDAKKSLIYYDQNRRMTNFPYFLASSEAEQDSLTINARKLLFAAEEAKDNAENNAAIRDYTQGLAIWREVLQKYPNFHRPDNSERTEEDTYEYELELTNLLKEDGNVRRRAVETGEAMRVLFPGLAEYAEPDILDDVAEEETLIRISMLDKRVQEQAKVLARDMATESADTVQSALQAVAGNLTISYGGPDSNLIVALENRMYNRAARQLVETEFDWLPLYKSRPFKDSQGNYAPVPGDYWVRPSARESVRSRLGLIRTSDMVEAEDEDEPIEEPDIAEFPAG